MKVVAIVTQLSSVWTVIRRPCHDVVRYPLYDWSKISQPTLDCWVHAGVCGLQLINSCKHLIFCRSFYTRCSLPGVLIILIAAALAVPAFLMLRLFSKDPSALTSFLTAFCADLHAAALADIG